MKQIQEWLGHSDFSTTANVYAHLDYNAKLSSASAMESGMESALDVFRKWELSENLRIFSPILS